MSRAALPVDLRPRVVELAHGAIVRCPDGAAIPRQPGRIVIAVKEQACVAKIGWRPQPEELRRARWRQHLRVAHAHRAHAPGTVAGTDKAVEALTQAVELDPALVAAVLR